MVCYDYNSESICIKMLKYIKVNGFQTQAKLFKNYFLSILFNEYPSGCRHAKLLIKSNINSILNLVLNK